jgi:ribose/xylose/arabinose/galactoside ABC-type transport system permease subunit
VIYSGISVSRVKIIIFMVSGLMAALAGLVLAARYGSTRPDIGTGLELPLSPSWCWAAWTSTAARAR